MKTKIVMVVAMTLALSACGLQQVKPADVESHVDPISVHDYNKLNADVSECTAYANKAVQEAQKKAIWGAILGGLAGAAVGSAIGSGTGYRSNFAAAGAAEGIAVGGTANLPYAQTKQQMIIYNCLVHRGYQLLY